MTYTFGDIVSAVLFGVVITLVWAGIMLFLPHLHGWRHKTYNLSWKNAHLFKAMHENGSQPYISFDVEVEVMPSKTSVRQARDEIPQAVEDIEETLKDIDAFLTRRKTRTIK